MANFLQKLFTNPPVPVEKAVVAPYPIYIGGDGPDTAPKGDYSLQGFEKTRWTLESYWTAYHKSPWLRRCVKTIARSIAKNVEIIPRDPKAEPNPVDVDKIQTFLNNLHADPNTPETFEAFISKALISLMVYGHTVCELKTTAGKADLAKSLNQKLEKSFQSFDYGTTTNYQQEIDDTVGEIVPPDGIPAYLRILPTSSIEVVADKMGTIKKYKQWGASGKQVTFLPEEIFHLVHPDSFDFQYGESQIENLFLLATLDRLIDERQRNVLTGDAAIDTIFTIDEMNPDAVKRLAQTLETKYRGANAVMRFLVVPKGVEAQDLSKSHEGDYLQLKQWIRDEICLNMGVPLSVLGVVSGTAGKGSGADQHMRNWVENTLRPLAVYFEAAFNRQIMARFQNAGLDYIIKFVLEDADDASDVASRLNVQIRAGIMTPNEARKVINLAPVAGGDTPFVDAKAPTPLENLGQVAPLPIAQQNAVSKAMEALQELRKAW